MNFQGAEDLSCIVLSHRLAYCWSYHACSLALSSPGYSQWHPQMGFGSLHYNGSRFWHYHATGNHVYPPQVRMLKVILTPTCIILTVSSKHSDTLVFEESKRSIWCVAIHISHKDMPGTLATCCTFNCSTQTHHGNCSNYRHVSPPSFEQPKGSTSATWFWGHAVLQAFGAACFYASVGIALTQLGGTCKFQLGGTFSESPASWLAVQSRKKKTLA